MFIVVKQIYLQNTAFRGFGGPQGMFVIECAIAKAANEIGISKEEIQYKNLIQENDSFYYGQIAKKVEAKKCWKYCYKNFWF